MQNRNLSLWDAAAEKFREIQSGSVHSEHNYAYVKQLLPLLAPAGKRVLDAGCGYGGYSRIFLDAGAAVTMLDGSAEMLRLAAESCPEAEAVQATLEQPLSFADGSFDICFCNQVLMDLPDITHFFPEAARVLTAGGRLFVSIVHPCFYDAPWNKDEQGNRVSKTMHRYLSQYILENHAGKSGAWGNTLHFHRPLHSYFNAAAEAGLRLVRMDEPCNHFDAHAGEEFPLFLHLLFEKP